MKKYIKLLSATLISTSLLISGCTQYLDIAPETKVDEEGVDYKNIANMYGPVSGVYAITNKRLSGWMGQGLIVVRGDDVNKGSTAVDQVEFTYCKNFEYDRIKSYWALNAYWGNLYGIVSTANDALTSLDKYAANLSSEDDIKKNKEYQAEVRFLRAYAYFSISNLWGNAPLVTDNAVFKVGKTPVGEIRKFILDELTFCKDNLPAVRPNERQGNVGAITKYSALALMAKVAMYSNDFTTTLNATNEIITSGKFNLYADYYNLFKIPGKLSNESLFELQFTDFGNGTGDIVDSDLWFSFQGPSGNNNIPSHISGWGFITPTTDLINFFTARGEKVRATTTFLYANSTTPSGDVIAPADPGRPTCYNGKAYTPSNQLTPGRLSYGANNNIRVLRYADVLLMNAEAKVRLGQNGDSPLNIVRQRAGLDPLTGATLQDVLDERRAELAIEWGERFYDLVRTNQAQTLLPGFVKGVSEYYPIPQAQIDLNPLLK